MRRLVILLEVQCSLAPTHRGVVNCLEYRINVCIICSVCFFVFQALNSRSFRDAFVSQPQLRRAFHPSLRGTQTCRKCRGWIGCEKWSLSFNRKWRVSGFLSLISLCSPKMPNLLESEGKALLVVENWQLNNVTLGQKKERINKLSRGKLEKYPKRELLYRETLQVVSGP